LSYTPISPHDITIIYDIPKKYIQKLPIDGNPYLIDI